jgi:membrane-associated phospholipid phosphatase
LGPGVRVVLVVGLALAVSATARAQDVARPLMDESAYRTALRDQFQPDAGAAVTPVRAVLQDRGGAAQQVPERTHTGLAALVVETARDFQAFPRRRSTWVILAAGGALALAAHPADRKVNAHLAGSSWAQQVWKPGKYVGGVGMAIAPVGIYLIGRYVLAPAADEPQTNKWSHLGFDLVRAQIVNEVLVQGIKFSVRRTRPNGSNYSFPSGHAAATFAFAAVLERHLGYRFAWPTVVLATYVATSRLHDNVHYLSDVVFGAALGTTVGWTVVGRHGRTNYALVPVIVPGGVALSITRVGRDAAHRSM